ncbi:DNA/RNA non-specific endonuclease [Cyclobacterium lianum]|uniref:DNA/RNA non-specific endonuclease n=1 Tax=Cyclobacterium lianum TaxID=388280 RepID=UPI0015B4BB86|nr:DNA/RNA non-specific endonuclease [Cyclobacterium lianum]
MLLAIFLAFQARKEWKKNAERFHSDKQAEAWYIEPSPDERAPEQLHSHRKKSNSLPHLFLDSVYVQTLLLPQCSKEKELQVIHHEFFSLAYDESTEQAAWVSYRLNAQLLSVKYERTDNFKDDPRIESGSAQPDDYRHSGYDRGHLAPAADFSHSLEAMRSSFLMSNISPQRPGFNRGIWKKLEEQVRSWTREYGYLLVITGPLFEEEAARVFIGKNEVRVPDYFFKVIFDIQGPPYKMLAFLLKNEKSGRPLLDHVVSVDSLEQFSGIDFFETLPDSLEIALENEIDYDIWFE